jgi:serine/threonine protein phosphatase PrpC
LQSELDVTSYLYFTLADIIYKTLDNLDRSYMEENPYYGSSSGCTVNMILLIGRKLIVVNLGDNTGYLSTASETI